MDLGFRAMLLAGGMFQLAMPAFAQPADLTAPLSTQSASATNAEGDTNLFLAHVDVEQHQWAAAEAELERSETFLLNSGTTSTSGVVTSPSLAMPYVIRARMDVGQHDQVDAMLAIDRAQATLSAAPTANQAPVMTQASSTTQVSVGANSPAVTVVPSRPTVTKALLPGHWQLIGWQYHWVPPDTDYRLVQSNPYITGHYEYRDGAWIWVAGHYAPPAS